MWRVEDIRLVPSRGEGGEDAEMPVLERQRQRLAQSFEKDRGQAKKSANLAIYGKPSGPPKEIDDPEQEPAPKLAIKRIRHDELPSSQLRVAQEDFQRELQILLEMAAPCQTSSSTSGMSHEKASSFSPHPNIIELYGIGFENDHCPVPKRAKGYSPFNKNLQPSFLLLSQIRTTLAQRLVKWREDKGIGLYEALSIDVVKRRNQWVERLLVLCKVAHAVQHLHHHTILYRDIKPANIGYDAMDIPKLFDFGLAKKVTNEMRRRNNNQQEDELEEGMFHLTPETGTLRYMAIEVGKGRPYGWSADVYSLAILMQEVLSLQVPFANIAPRQFRQVIWNQGHGLVVDPSWPMPIQELLPQMWNSNPMDRPTIQHVVTVLDDMLRGSDEDLFPKCLLVRGRRFSLF